MAKQSDGVGGLSNLDAICAKLTMNASEQMSLVPMTDLRQIDQSADDEDDVSSSSISSSEAKSIQDNNNESSGDKLTSSGDGAQQRGTTVALTSTLTAEDHTTSSSRDVVEDLSEMDLTVTATTTPLSNDASTQGVAALELGSEASIQISMAADVVTTVPTDDVNSVTDSNREDDKPKIALASVSVTSRNGSEPLPGSKDGTASSENRKSRRKNFQPRCIQGPVECRPESPLASWNVTAAATISPEVVELSIQRNGSCSEVSHVKGESDTENSGYSALDLRVTYSNSRDNIEVSMASNDVGLVLMDSADALDLSRGRLRPKQEDTPTPISLFSDRSDRPNRPSWGCSKSPLTAAEEEPVADHRGRKLMTGGGQVKVESDRAEPRNFTKSPSTMSMTMNDLMAVYGLHSDVASGGTASRASTSSFQRFPSPSLSSWNADRSVLDRYGRSRDGSPAVTAHRGRLDDTVSQLARPDTDEENAEDDASKGSMESLSDSMSSSASNVTAASMPGRAKQGRSHGLLKLLTGTKRAYEADLDSDGTSPSTKTCKTSGTSKQRQQSVTDYTRFVSQNIQRFESYVDCGAPQCRDKDYKEHFHCTACSVQVSLKKDKIVRHYKWHKKRDDSLQQGFLRFSPVEDCSKKCAPNCSHNGRNTHYHCIQDGCNKVYISTSDVQMHANFHRKDTAIIQEGFQRFRATENCNSSSCMFAEQKTTHFHCRRPGCSFTFKNKSDMEKHKMYHQKDEMLARDGFKKFMKYEPCNFTGCPYSHLSNHIHCIRPGCNYVLHSSGQLFSHKRKHERRTVERGAYKHFRSILPAAANAVALQSPSKTITSLSSFVSHGTTAGLFFSQPSFATVKPIPLASQSFAAPDIKPDVKDLLTTTGVKSELKVEFPFSVTEPGTKKSSWSESPCASPQPMDLCSAREDYNNEPPSSNELIDTNDLAPLARLKTGVDLSSAVGASSHAVRPSESSPALTQLVSKLGDARSESNLAVVCASVSTPNTSLSSAPTTTAIVPSAVKTPFAVPKPIAKTADRKERDDSWKSYLTRYTANDVCHVRCQLLYKDHYHCIQPMCGTLFRSKDGVRDHARLHEQQDRVTSLTFTVSKGSSPCPSTSCEHTEQLHYHCNWAGCDFVVLSTDSVFARLEHHKSHEYSSRRSSVTSGDMLRHGGKRRGRPPKYDAKDGDETMVVPTVPRIELTDDGIRARAAVDGPSSPIAFGFVKYVVDEPCPDARCSRRGVEHYHCARRRCHFVETGDNGALAAHVRDFHAHVQIKDGFEFFDASVDCRRPKCRARRGGPGPSGVRHFHCIQPRCDYAFVRFSTMSQHARKHALGAAASSKTTASVATDGQRGTAVGIADQLSSQAAAGLLLSKLIPGLTSSLPPAAAAMNAFIQQAMLARAISGSFFPAASSLMMAQSADGLHTPVLPSSTSAQSTSVAAGLPPVDLSTIPTPMFVQSLMNPTQLNLAGLQTVLGLGASTSTPSSTTVSAFDGRPLSALLQSSPLSTSSNTGGAAVGVTSNSRTFDEKKPRDHYTADENCGRPFCKLKKRDHHHCLRCGLAFSDVNRLRVHVTRQCSSAGSTVTGNAGSSTDVVRHDARHEQQQQQLQQQTDRLVCVPPSTVSLTTGSIDVVGGRGVQLIPDGGGEESNCITGNGADKIEDEEETMNGNEIDENGEDNSDDVGNFDNHDDDDDDDAGYEDDDGEMVIDLSASKSHDDGNSDSSSMLVDNNNTSAAAAATDRKSSYGRNNEIDPLGYDRYRSADDCRLEKCTYRGTMTHYHCRRVDCGYSFCDRARFASHAERHRRIDAIAGDQFVQCHAKAPCSWDPSGSCPLAARGATHYHCRQCPSFVCTDATKIAAHRKRHARLDRVAVDGFNRFAVGADCGDANCSSKYGRVSHSHCTRPGCGQVVVGTAQMALHKALHDGSTNGVLDGKSAISGGSGNGGQTSTLFQPLASLAGLIQLPVIQPSAVVSAAV